MGWNGNALGVEHSANGAAVAVCLRDAAPDATNSGLNSLAILLLPGGAVHVAHALAQVEGSVLLVVNTFDLEEGCAHVLGVAPAAGAVRRKQSGKDHDKEAAAECSRRGAGAAKSMRARACETETHRRKPRKVPLAYRRGLEAFGLGFFAFCFWTAAA